MAAINGVNLGLGLVTCGLETDFPEDERNTNPGAASVVAGVLYKIRNVDYVGTATLQINAEGGTILQTILEPLHRMGASL